MRKEQLLLALRGSAVALLVALAAACAEHPAVPSGDAPVASFAVTLDGDGYGFVGKGDVQLVFGWNNKALQDNAASVDFRLNSVVVTEVSWTCTNSNNQNTQERERTTTTTTAGLVESVARVKNQITGFNLEGPDGSWTESSTTEGNPLNSCPSGPWTLTTPAGDPEVVDGSGGGLEVSINGVDWFPLPTGEEL